MNSLRIVIVDDHPVVREGIRAILQSTGEFEVVGEAGNGAEGLALIEEVKPDVVLCDVRLPDYSGMQLIQRLRRRQDSVPVLLLSVHDNTEYVLQAVRADANGYLLKDSSPKEIRSAIHKVYEGDRYFSPAVANALAAAIQAKQRGGDVFRRLEQLTPREREVLVLVARGLTNRETAARLNISHRTVETHREHLMRKLELNSTVELVRFAMEHGLVGD
jgi:DNA-binding NarL/FixJ family response regulator